MTYEEMLARQKEIDERRQAINEEAGDEPLSKERQTEWDQLTVERDGERENGDGGLVARIAGIRERREAVERAAANPAAVERGSDEVPNVNRGSEDPFDLSTVRSSFLDPPEKLGGELRGRVLKAIEGERMEDDHKERATRLVERFEGAGLTELCRMILATGNPAYKRGFAKYLAGQPLSEDESRAMTVGTGAQGGFAVPYDLDPTIIGTWTPGVSPVRDLCVEAGSVRTTVSNEWRGVTSGGVAAAYAAEATEASDNSPTLAQPSIFPERAQAFIPFSFELDQDWGELRTELTNELQIAREDLEATKFLKGTGHANNQPAGILDTTVGLQAGQTVTTAGAGAFALADVYSLIEALPVRHRNVARARFLSNLTIIDKVRQFNVAGTFGAYVELTNDHPQQLVGRPLYEASPMDSAVTTTKLILLLGNFQGYRVIDRVGMSVEVIPHLFGAANRFPTGQRGIYAFWRNSAKLVNADAFRVLKVQ